MRTTYVSFWIKRFLLEYLISIRNLSKNTQISYRDTFRLLLPLVAKKKKRSVDKLLVEDITHEIIKAFLTELETGRNCSPSTRNQRLSALHAFAKFIGLNSPEHMEWCRLVQTIPFKRSKRTLITYLEKSEMDTLLNTPDRKTDQGRRDYALLLFLYNTGARADETAQLKVSDLNIGTASKKELATVLIRGKGNKPRRCPLWQQTAFELNTIIAQRIPSEYMFLNRLKQPLTRFGIHAMVKRCPTSSETTTFYKEKESQPTHHTSYYRYAFIAGRR